MTVVKLRDSFPSFLDEFFGGDIFDSPKRKVIGNSLPAVNVKENEDHFLLEVAAPGMKKEDFNLELDNNVLGISAEKEAENIEEKERYTRREFSYSSFNRSFTLPESVEAENINAKYDDGVLSVVIPKIKREEKVKTKKIDIS